MTTYRGRSFTLCALFLAAVAPSIRATDHEAVRVKSIQKATVVFLGDSLTSNNGRLGPQRGYNHWADTVQQRFALEVVNLGKGGSRVDGGLERLRAALAAGLKKPDFVLINFGMNDHKIREKDGQAVSSPEDFERQLTELVAAVRTAGAIPILVTPHKIHEGSPGDRRSYYDKYSPENFATEGGALARFDKFIDIIRKVAASQKVDLVDLRAESDKHASGALTLDGVHLNGEGHRMYGETITAHLSGGYAQ
jgi:lysophospholipase L1-like esterase